MIPQKIKNHSYPISHIFGNRIQKGEVGIEIETIGKNLPGEMQETHKWAIHPDDSVKGRPGEQVSEYVLSKPLKRDKVAEALDDLHKEFERCKSTIAEDRISNSVHVHINAQELSVQQVYTWLTLYYIFEELLIRWAGTSRIGNLFCLRAKDAEGVIQMLAKAAKDDAYSAFGLNEYRYASANVCALAKYGSLEFRALRGTVNRQVILDWIDILLSIKDVSLEYKNPAEVLADMSKRSCFGLINKVIPLRHRPFFYSHTDFQDSMYDGARLAQDYAHVVEWANKIEVPEKPKRGQQAMYNTIDSALFTQAPISIPNWDESIATAPTPLVAIPRFFNGTMSGTSPMACLFQRTLISEPHHSIRIKRAYLDYIRSNGWTVKWMNSGGTGGKKALGVVRVTTNGTVLMEWVRASKWDLADQAGNYPPEDESEVVDLD